MASFLGVLGDVGRVALKIVPFLPIPGPVGAVSAAVSAAIDQEMTGKAGAEKKAAAMSVTAAALAANGVPTEGRLALVSDLLEGCVAVLNALAKLFGGTPSPQTM